MAKNMIRISMLAAALALLITPVAYGGEKPVAGKRHHVEGEKLDSGLGKLPHYRHWAKHPATKGLVALTSRVPGEKLDSGLGELPHYRHWAKHPATKGLVALTSRVPGEKLDSGLGELPPYREWAGNTDNRHLAVVESASSK